MERLTNHNDFVRVLRHRRKVSSKDVVVHFLVHDVSRVVNPSNSDPQSSNVSVDSGVGDVVDTGSDLLGNGFEDIVDAYISDDANLEGADGTDNTENLDVGADALVVDAAPYRRLGLAVSKAVGNAVKRNRVKRRFRALARAYGSLLPDCCDIVMRAKPSVVHASYASLAQQTQRLFTDISRKATTQNNATADNVAVIG